MTKDELIEKMKEMPGNSQIAIYCDYRDANGFYEIKQIEFENVIDISERCTKFTLFPKSPKIIQKIPTIILSIDHDRN